MLDARTRISIFDIGFAVALLLLLVLQCWCSAETGKESLSRERRL